MTYPYPYEPTPKQRKYLKQELDAAEYLAEVIENMSDDELWSRLGEVHSYLNRTDYLDQFSFEFWLLNEELSLRKDPDYPIVDFQIRATAPANPHGEIPSHAGADVSSFHLTKTGDAIMTIDEDENYTIEERHQGSYRTWCDCCRGDRWHRYVHTNRHGNPVYECTECWETVVDPSVT